jgi:hypothetical protein
MFNFRFTTFHCPLKHVHYEILLCDEAAVTKHELSPWLDAKRYNIRAVTLPVEMKGKLSYAGPATRQTFEFEDELDLRFSS